MGFLLSKFRRKKSTLEVLQTIKDDICWIEQYKIDVQKRRRRMLAIVVTYSVLLYLLAGLLVYYYYLPPDLVSRALYCIPLLVFPLVIVMIRRLLAVYFDWKLSRNQKRFSNLLEKKKKILDDVQDNETYRVAKEILEKFAPEILLRSPIRPNSGRTQDSAGSLSLRQRPGDLTSKSQTGTKSLTVRNIQATPISPYAKLQHQRQSMMSASLSSNAPSAPHAARPTPNSALPRPVLQREPGYLDRMMNFLVGDGPSNRFALICSHCHGHNGMALREEFEYLAFRCCYCLGWNPSRKQRPSAPKLPAAPTIESSDNETDTTETSGSESDSVAVDDAAGGVAVADTDGGVAAIDEGAGAVADTDGGVVATEVSGGVATDGDGGVATGGDGGVATGGDGGVATDGDGGVATDEDGRVAVTEVDGGVATNGDGRVATDEDGGVATDEDGGVAAVTYMDVQVPCSDTADADSVAPSECPVVNGSREQAQHTEPTVSDPSDQLENTITISGANNQSQNTTTSLA